MKPSRPDPRRYLIQDGSRRSRQRRPESPFWPILVLVLIICGWFVGSRFVREKAKTPATPTPAALTNPPAGLPARSPAQPSAGSNVGKASTVPTPRGATNIQAGSLKPPEPTSPAPKPAPPVGLVSPQSGRDIFEAQLALDRLGISPGSLDGAMGQQTRAAIRAFQVKRHLPATGELDAPTRDQLVLSNVPLCSYTIQSNDMARLQPLSSTWVGKSQQSALDYETVLELLAERGHCHPSYLRQLNPSVVWSTAAAGTLVRLPDVARPEPVAKAAFVRIALSARILEAFDAETNLLAHFPCSIARQVDKRPVGELHVVVVAPDPNYTFNPELFPESAEARQLTARLVLPPGPNNPVGIAWIGLDKPGYGIHGTPSPEQVGRTESHGCFRLANWNAEYLLKLISIGTPVFVEP